MKKRNKYYIDLPLTRAGCDIVKEALKMYRKAHPKNSSERLIASFALQSLTQRHLKVVKTIRIGKTNPIYWKMRKPYCNRLNQINVYKQMAPVEKLFSRLIEIYKNPKDCINYMP